MSHISNLPTRAFGLFTLLVLGSLAGPALADNGRRGATLFRDASFKGQHQTFHGDVRDLGSTFVGNDAVSSIALDRGCQVRLFSDANFGGRSIELHDDVADLSRTRIGNDRASSIRVKCRGDGHSQSSGKHGGLGPGVTVYSDAGFRGSSETITQDDRDLRDNRIRQDTISSVVVHPGCWVVLYDDIDFRGAATKVRNKHDNLEYSAVGNDRVSSIRVECRRR